MSETVAVALITGLAGVLAGLLGAILLGRSQLRTTKLTIDADREKLSLQIRGEVILRAEERRREMIREALAEVLAASDPQLHERIDYGRVVTQIHRVQLLLRTDGPEAMLNGAMNEIGNALQAYIPLQSFEMRDRQDEMIRLLRAQSNITDAGKAALHAPYPGLR